jgi:hypothetical protein
MTGRLKLRIEQLEAKEEARYEAELAARVAEAVRDFKELMAYWYGRERCDGMTPAEEVAWLAGHDKRAAWELFMQQVDTYRALDATREWYYIWRYGEDCDVPERGG